MATRVIFHPTLGRFLRLLLIAIGIALAVSLVLRLTRGLASEPPPSAAEPSPANSIADSLVPALILCVPDGANEATWTESLVASIGGRREVVIPNGRIDVMTETFAMEVDFMNKWHEGIGQALHYASATGKRAALALVVRHVDWPLTPDRVALLREIDRLTSEQKIRLVILRPGCS